jgi:simple sugar transport system ATP-binding protein
MKILCGIESPDTGKIFINGKEEKIDSPLAANKLGLGMVHQHFMLFPEYTVAQNIVMGEEPRKYGIFFDTKEAENIADRILGDNGFAVKSVQKVKDLSIGEMQQVEICRVLHRNAGIIILDEPTSILTERETQALFTTLRHLRSKGKSLILITHKLNEIKQICDRVAVMRKGEIVGVRDNAEIDEREIAKMMMGADLVEEEVHTKARRHEGHKDGEKVIEFENVTVRKRGQERALLDCVSFGVGKGEILGFTGVGGNGLGVIEAVLGGFLHPAEGRVLHNGTDITGLSMRRLRNQGLSYVPSDRMRLGSARDAAIDENIIINRRVEFMNNFRMNKNTIKEFSDKLFGEFNIEGAVGNKKCNVLSGGNLQKLVLAREINWFKDYIVFAEPTWGLDIASSGFIMGEIEKLRDKGAAVVLISTNLNEILALSDRVIVMYRGRAAGVFENTGGDIKSKIGICMQTGASQ